MNLKHGYANPGNIHPLYQTWVNMKRRCYDKESKLYPGWGGRGITVCQEWLDPKTFIDWALENGWKKGLIIDRIDNDGDYEPGNIRFINHDLSLRNSRLLRLTNTSGYRGVSYFKKVNKWRARIIINSEEKHLGLFNSPRLAAIRYDVEAFILNDGRPLNFIN